MARSLEQYAEATTLTVLAVTTLGTLVYLIALLITIGGESVLETVGAMPAGWYADHLSTLTVAAGTMALPEIAFGGYWLFRRALNGPDA